MSEIVHHLFLLPTIQIMHKASINISEKLTVGNGLMREGNGQLVVLHQIDELLTFPPVQEHRHHFRLSSAVTRHRERVRRLVGCVVHVVCKLFTI